MTDDKSNDNSPRTPIRNKLKSLRKMLGISYREISDALDMSVKEIERAENLKSPDTISSGASKIDKIKKYVIEIYDSEKNRLGARELDLFDFDGIDLLLQKLERTCEYVIEFCGRIKPGNELYDEFDKVSYEDNNVLEITDIKKVKSNI